MGQRVLTALVLGPVVLAALFSTSPYPLFVLGLFSVAIGFFELRTMLKSGRTHPVLTLAGFVLPFYALVVNPARSALQLGLLAVGFFALGTFSAHRSSRRLQNGAAVVDLAGLWVAMPLAAILMVHHLGEKGPAMWNFANPALMLLLPLWAGDIAAIFVGRAWGKHLLMPAVSPMKTWEGSIGNLAACILVAALLARPLGLSLGVGVLCGALTGTWGQAGDLFESAIKRKAGVKDSGTLLPGHGGLLDRIDSLLFSAPFVALVLLWTAR